MLLISFMKAYQSPFIYPSVDGQLGSKYLAPQIYESFLGSVVGISCCLLTSSSGVWCASFCYLLCPYTCHLPMFPSHPLFVVVYSSIVFLLSLCNNFNYFNAIFEERCTLRCTLEFTDVNLAFNPTILLLGICPRETKMFVLT